MGHYRFGKQEELHCIQPVALRGPKGEALCVGYKTTTTNVFGPVFFHDDGYVLCESGPNAQSYYPMPQGTELSALQTAGELPNPLPAYHLSAGDYLFGFFMWPALAAVVGFYGVAAAFKRRRHASLRSQQPPSIGAPELRTKTDRWLAQEAQKLLVGNETVQQQAYGTSVDMSERDFSGLYAMYLVLTDRRLLLIRCRVGAFGPLRENDGVRSFERTQVAQVDHDERHLRFHLTTGETLDFFAEWSERHLSNQRRFLRDVPRLLGRQPAPSA